MKRDQCYYWKTTQVWHYKMQICLLTVLHIKQICFTTVTKTTLQAPSFYNNKCQTGAG